ncbi:MAG: hypothetical protein WCL14_11645 [Bacteroidota bacterium]
MDARYLYIGTRLKHPDFEEGVIIQVKPTTYSITFMKHGTKEISRNYQHFEVMEGVEPPEDMVSLADVERIFTNIIKKYSDLQERVELGNRWLGGTMILKPKDPNLKPKEFPIDVFFGKIVMLRDRLRVLEQRVNSNDKLTEEERMNMQQYITRCYGSLTTFNVLFKNVEDHFVGDKGAGKE